MPFAVAAHLSSYLANDKLSEVHIITIHSVDSLINSNLIYAE